MKIRRQPKKSNIKLIKPDKKTNVKSKPGKKKIISALKSAFKRAIDPTHTRGQLLLPKFEKKHGSPVEYSTVTIKKMSADFSEFKSKHNNFFKIKELPIDPRTIILDPKDPLYLKKREYVAKRYVEKLTKPDISRKIGNVFEVKLITILKNKKLSVPEKRRQLILLIKELNAYEKNTNLDNKITELYNERKELVKNLQNIFSDMTTYSPESNSVYVVREKEIVSFFQNWRSNLYEVNSILNQYKEIRADLYFLRKKIKITANNLR